MNVGKKIRHLREQKGLTQEAVAYVLHISQPTYARLENGDRNSWANYIEPLCSLFEIQPEDLFKQDTLIINQNQQGGNGAFIINQLSEQLIAQYEENSKLKDDIIADLKKRLSKHE
ncbi:helix-turn-helix domain-containing protein [Winogradskyella sp. PAMC22761]|nr:helix-turn-helix domain-containing protein [Winogradskyella sp. PAMC22761]